MIDAAEALGMVAADGLTIIGMDPASYRNVGWAVIRMELGSPKLLAKFTQELTRQESDIGRYRDIYDELAKIISEHKPHILCLERSMGGGLAFVRNNLSENVGVAKMCCYDHGVKVYETSPAHLKKIITGSGKAKKKDIKASIVAAFGLDKPGPEHECDAAACCLSLMIDLGWKGYSVKVPFSESP